MKIIGVKLDWKDDEFLKRSGDAIEKVLVEVGLRAEGKAKTKLQPSLQIDDRFVKGGGRGMRTATLRRSIHIATPGYSWGGDDIKPGSSSPERGGAKAAAKRTGKTMIIEIGSGMNYSVYVHELHYNPTVHHFLLDSVNEVKPELPGIIERSAIT